MGSAPVGYVAVTRSGERRFAARLGQRTRADLRRINLVVTGLVALFLDGTPCASHLTLDHVTRTATTVTVRLHYTRAPLGPATCAHARTSYLLIGASRKTLGRPAPHRVRVIAVARA